MPDSKGKLVGVTALLIAWITLCVSVRVFVRSVVFASVAWDDVLVFLSYGLTITLCSCVLAMTNFGLGTSIASVHADTFRQFRKLQFATQLSYVWGFVTVKMSFAVLYIRLLPSDLSRRMNQVLLVVLTAEGLTATMVVIFQCSPVDKAWNPQNEGRCLDLRLFYYISFAIKLITDVCLFVQPIPAIWKMHLTKVKRLGAIFMLSIGLFVCVIAIIRVTYIGSLGADITKSLVTPMIWSQVEVCALIICATIPSFRPFLRHFHTIGKAMGLSSSKESGGASNGGRHPLPQWVPAGSETMPTEIHPQAVISSPMSMGDKSAAHSQKGPSDNTQQIAPERHTGPDEIVVTHEIDVVLQRPGGDIG